MASSVGIVEALRQLELEFEKSHANLEYVIDKLETEFMRIQFLRSSQMAVTGLTERSDRTDRALTDVATPNPCKLLRKLRYLQASLPRVRRELEDVMLEKQFLASFILTRLPPLQERISVLAAVAGVPDAACSNNVDDLDTDDATRSSDEKPHVRCIQLATNVQRGIKEYVDDSMQAGGYEIAMSHALYRSAFCGASEALPATHAQERQTRRDPAANVQMAHGQRAKVSGKENRKAQHDNTGEDRSRRQNAKDTADDTGTVDPRQEKRLSQSRQSIQSHQSLHSASSSLTTAATTAKTGASVRSLHAPLEPISKQTFQRLPRNMKVIVSSLDDLNKAFELVRDFVGEGTVTDENLSQHLLGHFDPKVLSVLSGAGVLRSCMCPGGVPGWKLK
ncbi:hypothetical protein FVE85_0736 [Porphyridium purpureum]|uniref:Uncharacterized protein n=1 Tax=Porphyridium purpureum TaxID=35688 RepID=A0A5J4Z2U9_PORPP|nr:hypothetical protein FVE85_0736 [Porphyridium purpureum]|eukprot:POR9043..scf208_2